MKYRFFYILCCAFLFTNIFVVIASENTAKLDAIIHTSASVLDELNQIPDQAIPSNLWQSSHAIAIFPGAKKGGYIFGGQFGRGVISYRDHTTGQWSPPAFFLLRGGSFGLQAGIQEMDLVFMFPSKKSFDSIFDSNLRVGAEFAATAGPVGRDIQVNNTVKNTEQVFAYSKSKGLFAGVALSGTQLKYDYKSTKLYYNDAYSAKMILLEKEIQHTPASAEVLITRLRDYIN